MTAPPPTVPGEAPPAVATHGLVKRFGSVVALDGVDLRVPRGAVYVLAGANGAGKTTLLEVLIDLARADAGTAEVFGLDARRSGAEVRARTGYVPASSERGYRWMTVGRLMRHHAAFYPGWDGRYADRLVALFDLPLDRPFGALSRGVSRRVQLVLALAHRPPLLLLDEPTDGLDLVARDDLLGALADHLGEREATVLVSTHLVSEMEPLADYLGVLRAGRLTAQLPLERLRRMLRRYRAAVPKGWEEPDDLGGDVLRREGGGREIRWTVWGDEAAVTAGLVRSGARVWDVAALSLTDTVLALLRSDPR